MTNIFHLIIIIEVIIIIEIIIIIVIFVDLYCTNINPGKEIYICALYWLLKILLKNPVKKGYIPTAEPRFCYIEVLFHIFYYYYQNLSSQKSRNSVSEQQDFKSFWGSMLPNLSSGSPLQCSSDSSVIKNHDFNRLKKLDSPSV